MIILFNKEHKDTFEAIQNGKKRVETRAATKKYKSIEAGDELTFSCDGESFQKKVKQVKLFQSIDALCAVYLPKDINPKLKSKDDLINLYYSFPQYREKIKEYGLLAIELE